MSKLLLVIDMQQSFPASREKTLQDNIIKKIEEFKRREEYVVFLEYVGHSATIPRILNTVKGYNNTIRLKKNTNGGGDVFVDWHSRKNLGFKEIYVAGVNITACVLSTVQEIADHYRYKKIKVLTRHIGTPEYRDKKEDIEYLKNSVYYAKNVLFLK